MSNTASSSSLSPTALMDRETMEKKGSILSTVNSSALRAFHNYSIEKEKTPERLFEIASALQDSYRPVFRYLNDILKTPQADISLPFEKYIFEKIIWNMHYFHLNREVILKISFSDGYWEGSCEELGIFVASTNPEECIRDFQEEFYVLWEEYANEDDENLTADARELKYRILGLVKGVELAGENQ
ncbi:hypothetical protein RSJ42_15225 [Methanosarcina hadiensis]|uniref:hypothetical protein n=1 Tax=Methanosarcina hadiensis TaxID=3078083 RepID=UPI0039778210